MFTRLYHNGHQMRRSDDTAFTCELCGLDGEYDIRQVGAGFIIMPSGPIQHIACSDVPPMRRGERAPNPGPRPLPETEQFPNGLCECGAVIEAVAGMCVRCERREAKRDER